MLELAGLGMNLSKHCEEGEEGIEVPVAESSLSG